MGPKRPNLIYNLRYNLIFVLSLEKETVSDIRQSDKNKSRSPQHQSKRAEAQRKEHGEFGAHRRVQSTQVAPEKHCQQTSSIQQHDLESDWRHFQC